ncbi:SpoIIE family protein phosphatase [Pseudonocardia bannensis]|uniref:SpoIIE family protein phosphatase n=1 Tax=Pseudonocardia bannensis TaxID=630973 RepID=A0A848DS29_9PSEU|nr:SpoIIE family protein phosphatase [Pseudonocardia bannensis]
MVSAEMSPAALEEAARLAAVARYEILGTPPDGAFDRVAALAARWFDTPIATVSIVDEDRIWFKATHGLEGVTEIGREPGLCASAVRRDGPYVINDALTDPRAAENPLVRGEMGVRFYAAAPITTSDGYRLGTVNVLDTRPRQIPEAGLATLCDLAAIVMDQLELRLSALHTIRAERQLRDRAEQDRATIEQDRATIEAFASTLQRTLLPPALPDVPGLELASHYHPASPRNVGGDFYDVFPLPGDRWAFFLGDVCGHGAPAATLTSLARHTLRAAAWHDPRPVSVLSELNAALLNEPVTRDHFATVMFGLLQPDPGGPGFLVTVGTGGHEPALWMAAQGGRRDGTGAADVVELRPEGGMLVGAVADARFTACSARLGPGETLLLYTDGLTDTPVDGTPFGQEGLSRFLADRIGCTAATLVADLATRIGRFTPPPKDDIALLAMSVPRGQD